jgi:regulator of sigma E protease
MVAFLHQAADYSLLAVGLGFVIFFHELGHFLAAKYCDVKVEQFAVGFGPAIVAWRKGIGFRWGTTGPAYNKLVEAHIEEDQKRGRAETTGHTLDYAASIARIPGVGETEYRLNWIPLGGYVKMLGQDDLRPGATADDPRAFNKKSVGARMIIVSAGVIMNVILAAVGFMIVFMIGYPVPPATVGSVVANSPAARAATADGALVGLQPGDVLVSYDGKEMGGDFSRIPLNVALTRDGTRVAIVVKHVDGKEQTLYATPERPGSDGKGLLQLGVGQPFELAGPEPSIAEDEDSALLAKTDLPDVRALQPGDSITRIAGQLVNSDGAAAIAQLYAALDTSGGKPVSLTVRSSEGQIRTTTVTPHFADPFSGSDLSFLGMVPRASIAGLLDTSPALDKLKPGDAILAVDAGTDHLQNPTCKQIHDTLLAAGDKDLKVSLTVLDPGQNTPRSEDDLSTYHLPQGGGHIGLGISLGTDEQHLVVAETLPDTPAATAKIPAGATLTAVNGKTVANWFEIRQAVANASPGDKLAISYIPPDTDGKPSVAVIDLTRDDIDSMKQITLAQYLPLHPMVSALKTDNPLIALGRGIDETRDLILQFYVTLQRMLTGDVALSNVMGPVGMAHEGAQVASRGINWLLWFLSLISANLAVVNFLPIPIVDGGLFTLLILEKIQGKPLSPDAQRIVQMVGLVLILGVFLLVTYQDIARMAGY